MEQIIKQFEELFTKPDINRKPFNVSVDEAKDFIRLAYNKGKQDAIVEIKPNLLECGGNRVKCIKCTKPYCDECYGECPECKNFIN